MKKTNLILVFFFLILITSCTEPKPASKTEKDKAIDSVANREKMRDPKNYFKDCKLLLAEASKIDSVLYSETEVNQALGNKAIKAFTDYAYYCPNDSLSPIFLIKTAQIATSINNIPQAKTVLEKCIADYSKSKDITAAIFLLARLYDETTYLNNEEEARRLYQEIVDKYPKCAEAESAKGALKFIGKTDADLIKEFKKKEKRQTGDKKQD